MGFKVGGFSYTIRKARAGEEDLDFSYLLRFPTPLYISTENMERETKGLKISGHLDAFFN